MLYFSVMKTSPILLNEEERSELESCCRSRKSRADLARRARLILMLAAGDSYVKIEKALGRDASFISRWKHRFLEQRVAGLYSRHQGSVRTVLTPELEARILDRTRQTPSDGSTHWSTRRLAPRYPQRVCK